MSYVNHVTVIIVEKLFSASYCINIVNRYTEHCQHNHFQNSSHPSLHSVMTYLCICGRSKHWLNYFSRWLVRRILLPDAASRPPVCLSLRDVEVSSHYNKARLIILWCRGQIDWKSSKIISRIVNLGCSLSADSTSLIIGVARRGPSGLITASLTCLLCKL